MTDLHRGSCLCGAVRFQVEGTFDGFFLCHCSRCRKDTGSAHAANLFSGNARLTWLGGSDLVASFRLEGSRHAKAFCRQCGSGLPYTEQVGGFLVVPAGALDTPVDRVPDAHIFFGSRADWDQALEARPHFEGLPG